MQAEKARNERDPILSLPVEVICEIFTFAQLPGVSGGKDKSKRHASEVERKKHGLPVEIVISQVCQRWRSIALGLPKLWTTFFYAPRTLDFGDPLEVFDVYLERSAALPLSIWLDVRSRRHLSHDQLVEKAFQYVHRWKLFTLYATSRLRKSLYKLRDASAPMLECLSIVFDGNEYVQPVSLRPRILNGGAPKLSYVMLNGLAVSNVLPPLFDVQILGIEAGFHNIFPMPVFLELLSIPSLTQLSLEGKIVWLHESVRSIDMPNLERLRVCKVNEICFLLPSIRAPRLETLILSTCCTYEYGSSVDYTFPALRKLCVIDSWIDREVARHFTCLTSQATDIVISQRIWQRRDLLQMILDGGYAAEVWPRMKILSCDIKGTIDLYARFLQFRRTDSLVLGLPSALVDGELDEGLKALKRFSLVELGDGWNLDEQFCPPDTGFLENKFN